MGSIEVNLNVKEGTKKGLSAGQDTKVAQEEKKQTAMLGKNLLKLGMIGTAVGLTAKASPKLAGSFKLLEKSMFLFLRPLGNQIGAALLPISRRLLLMSSDFQKIFPDKKTLENNLNTLSDNVAEDVEQKKELINNDNTLSEEEKTSHKENLDEADKTISDLKNSVDDQVNTFEGVSKIIKEGLKGSKIFEQWKPSSDVQYETARVNEEETIRSAPGGSIYDWVLDLFGADSHKEKLSTAIFDELFSNIDTDESALVLKDNLELYFANSLGDSEVAKEVVSTAYGLWVKDTLGDSKSATSKTNNKTAMEYAADEAKKLIGEVPGGQPTVAETMDNLSTGAQEFVANSLESMSTKSQNSFLDLVDDRLSALENFSIDIAGSTFNPFAGILSSYDSPASTALDLLKSARSMFEIDDGIITKDGKVIKTNPNDDIFASKNGFKGMGTSISEMNVNITIQELNSDIQIERLAEKVSEEINRQVNYQG